MSVCLLVHPDGTRERVVWQQSTVAERLGGALTFVGALDHLSVVLVGMVDGGGAVNALSRTHPWLFFDGEVRGPVVFVASDDEGEEIDVDVETLETRLSSV